MSFIVTTAEGYDCSYPTGTDRAQLASDVPTTQYVIATTMLEIEEHPSSGAIETSDVEDLNDLQEVLYSINIAYLLVYSISICHDCLT